MANVRVCDRCGKKIESASFPIHVVPARFIIFMETDFEKYRYDLCKQCRNDLDTFMEGPSEGEVKE